MFTIYVPVSDCVEARVVIAQWLEIYNHSRPHRGLSMMTPAAFAATQ